MSGDKIRSRDLQFPVRLVVMQRIDRHSIFSEKPRAGIAQDMHLEPFFKRVFHKEPPVGLAGIEEKLPPAAFTGSLARFDPFRSTHLSIFLRL